MNHESTLTSEDVAMLRRPYHTNAVKWLPIGKASNSGVMMLPHIDASLVIERLSDVAPAWSETTEPVLLNSNPADPMGLAQQSPWICRLTVGGVTRCGYGQLDAMSAKLDGKSWKAGESDALKRAALKFGIGSYLRAIPTIWLNKQVGGVEAFKSREWQGKTQFSGLTAAGKKHLRAEYEKVVKHASFVEHYGEMIDYGDQADVEVEDVVVEADAPVVNEAETDVLLLLSKFNGRDTSEDVVRETLLQHPFGKLLPRILNSVKANLLLDAAPTDDIKKLAIAASEEDADALRELGDRLVAAQKAVEATS